MKLKTLFFMICSLGLSCLIAPGELIRIILIWIVLNGIYMQLGVIDECKKIDKQREILRKTIEWVRSKRRKNGNY